AGSGALRAAARRRAAPRRDAGRRSRPGACDRRAGRRRCPGRNGLRRRAMTDHDDLGSFYDETYAHEGEEAEHWRQWRLLNAEIKVDKIVALWRGAPPPAICGGGGGAGGV